MSLAVVHTRARVGIHAPLVSVEVHLSNGLAGLAIVGMPETAANKSIGEFETGQQHRHLCCSKTWRSNELCRRGGQKAINAAKNRENIPGQAQYILAGGTSTQENGQQLCIGESLSTCIEQFFPWSFRMWQVSQCFHRK